MYNYLINNKEYNKLCRELDQNKKYFEIKNICDNAKPYFISTFKKKKLVILVDEKKAISFFDDYKFYDKNCFYFPERDLLFQNSSVDNETIDRERINIIKKLNNNEEITVITTVSAILEKLEKVNNVFDKILNIKVNSEIKFDEFITTLIELGYKRVYEVSNVYEFSVRGGIIDIFEYTYDNPIRIEFFGNQIDSIRYYDIESKRSIEKIKEVQIYPAKTEIKKIDNNDDNEYSFILDYFNGDYLIFFDEQKRLIDKCLLIQDMLNEALTNREAMKLINVSENDDYKFFNIYNENIDIIDIFDYTYCFKRFYENTIINVSIFDDSFSDENLYIEKKQIVNISFSFEPVIFDKKNFINVKNEIKKFLDNGFTCIFVMNSYTKAERLVYEFNEYSINTFYLDDKNKKIMPGNMAIVLGEISEGFIDNENKFIIFSEKDVFGIEIERKKRILKSKMTIKDGFEPITEISKLNIGDYIVHDTFGVGIYRGIEKITSDDVIKEYLKLEYKDGGVLYLLVTKLEVIQKYASYNAVSPKLNKLNNNDFVRVKNRIKEDMLKYARELIELYSIRLSKKGYKFKEDTIWQKEFEETFEYIETMDQLKAIIQVKQDMENDKPMDRLICGDVGFGKTEVAIRASFKAVFDNKQVAYLVPTTVLAMQHYNTFIKRFANYPIKVDFLSRFKTKMENEKTVQKLKNGEIDIIIATHRLLSNDVEFKDLGLLIIDEEQRFGVMHKEKIKQLKKDIDVLSLSATPIPRTLYMSLSGIRDMSLLLEPPPQRIPIKTFVLEYNEELIREAIDRELNRNGQVFVIHNKVRDIYEFAIKITNLCKDAKVGVAHGKLDEKDLSQIMDEFVKGDINVLVSTTIIETGIDVQNANTLIVDDADNFGLSQLYQLRGRVGRSNISAYAFFMYKKNKKLNEESEKRLKAIKEFSALGSGIKIAMRDLEIRGAGNILGINQSGHIEAVGYELYCKLLNKALKFLKESDGKKDEDFILSFDTICDIDIDAYIPTNYIEDEDTKIDVYKKISKCETLKQFTLIEEELIDRFGKFPKEVENLIYIAKIKIKAKSLYMTDVNVKKDSLRIVFYEKAQIDGESFTKVIKYFNGRLKIFRGSVISLNYNLNIGEIGNINKMIDILNYIFESLKTYK